MWVRIRSRLTERSLTMRVRIRLLTMRLAWDLFPGTHPLALAQQCVHIYTVFSGIVCAPVSSILFPAGNSKSSSVRP